MAIISPASLVFDMSHWRSTINQAEISMLFMRFVRPEPTADSSATLRNDDKRAGNDNDKSRFLRCATE